MALTDQHRAAIRKYLGWSARFRQFDSALENGMTAVSDDPASEAEITNPITGDPPGLLASLADIDSKLFKAHGRIKATKVGSIELNRGEIAMLRSEGRRFAGRLHTLVLGPAMDMRGDAFGGDSGGGNFVGK